MAMDGLLALVCAGAVVTAGPPAAMSASGGDNRDSAVATTLAVQSAMQQGREHLLHGEYRAAVAALEAQLPYINGNAVYLKLLQDAYRRYIQELQLKKQETEAQRYQRRLIILDRGAILDNVLTGVKELQASPATPALTAAGPASIKPAPTVRMKSEDEDPFQASSGPSQPDDRARQLLKRAEEEYSNRHYAEARRLYEQAHDVDRNATAPCRERWAYCKLFCVVEQLNQAEVTRPNWLQLEREVDSALKLAPSESMAPLLDYGKSLLTEIQKRRTASSVPEENRRDPAVAVHHASGRIEGWCLAETANFRIFHNQSAEFAERVAQIVEHTRNNVQRKWFGSTSETWTPKCDVFLHATAQDYSNVTRQYNSPGHSFLKLENGRLVIRRIDLHCDDPNMLGAILPHETTHVVLAGEFSERLLPRWADEGIAVLTEPNERIERHLSNLHKCHQAGQFFRLQDLMQLEDYPKDTHYISAFYAQSVALVEFLAKQRGPQALTQFLHDGMRYGYEKALERDYGYHSFAELEQRWSQYVFRERGNTAEIAERSQ